MTPAAKLDRNRLIAEALGRSPETVLLMLTGERFGPGLVAAAGP